MSTIPQYHKDAIELNIKTIWMVDTLIQRIGTYLTTTLMREGTRWTFWTWWWWWWCLLSCGHHPCGVPSSRACFGQRRPRLAMPEISSYSYAMQSSDVARYLRRSLSRVDLPGTFCNTARYPSSVNHSTTWTSPSQHRHAPTPV